MVLRLSFVIFSIGAFVVSCARAPAKAMVTSAQEVATVPPVPEFGRLSREDFNRKAAELFVPLFWRHDSNNNQTLEPDELAVVWGMGPSNFETYVAQGTFTPALRDIYNAMVQATPESDSTSADARRRALVKEELAQGRPTLVETNLTQASEEDRAVVKHLLTAAAAVEKMYQRQKGVFGLDAQIPASDTESRMLFHRNQGPFCMAPRTENNKECSALSTFPKPVSGLYPLSLQSVPNYCDKLPNFPNGKLLTGHFNVVVDAQNSTNAYDAVPYPVAYKEDAQAVAKALRAAADILKSAEEKAFKAYLMAAAQAFIDNQWEKADEAWVKMGGSKSKWYLRVGPDEVYHEPCALKAGFHMSFARINPDSLAWQQKLEPVKNDMEKALAALAGPPYRARNVKFHLPDFIDIVVNAGDSRPPHGATIGQSLPNWGKVAEAGGRTVAMTNLYTDTDSRNALRDQMASLFCPATFEKVSTDPQPALMSTVLHEAAHNLGPSHDYQVKGKVDDQIFGGPLASIMEELKAQTSALYFSEWLVERNIITLEAAQAAHLRDVTWAFGHIAQGMYNGAGKPKTYSQLASIQLGTLLKENVLVWNSSRKAGNGADVGCFDVQLTEWKPVVDRLARRVLSAKGSGNKADAEAMKAEFVDAEGEWARLRKVIAERWLRAPKASFVYAIQE